MINFLTYMINPHVFILECSVASAFDEIKRRRILRYIALFAGLLGAFAATISNQFVFFLINAFLLIHHMVYLIRLYEADACFYATLANFQFPEFKSIASINKVIIMTDKSICKDSFIEIKENIKAVVIIGL